MTPFARSAGATLALLSALLLLERAHPSVAPAFVPRWLQGQVRECVYHGLNEEDELGLLAGYYTELLDASREATRGGDLDAVWERALHRGAIHERLDSFLLYRPKPSHGDAKDPASFHVTNSAGLFDRDYPDARTPGVRRIVWIGDSLSRGLGAPFGEALEPRVEAWLDGGRGGGRGAAGGVEVLNLAVEGYRLTQFMKVVDLALPRWRPDVVLVGLSDLSVARIWGHHLACLVHDGIDLEYPFLREIVARARLERDDPPRVADGKLAPFRAEFVRTALATIRASCAAAGVELVVALLPAVGESERLLQRFREAREACAALGLRQIDLVDTFAGVDDLADWRVSDIDHHPNVAGYERLFEAFAAALERDPATYELLAGRPLPARR